MIKSDRKEIFMKRTGIILVLCIVSIATARQNDWVNYYTGGLVEATYLWLWGFNEEPKSVENTGFTPGTAAVEVKWIKMENFDYTTWRSYGVYFGDKNFSMLDMVPDSVYFKLKAPDGVGESDRLEVWLYDPRNQDWNNASYYSLDNLQILQDKQWHQFSVSLFDFQLNVGETDINDIIAVSLERPAEDKDTEFPLMYIDHVWVGQPDFTAVEENTPTTVNDFTLEQNYPNPFNPATTITFDLGKSTSATLTILNLKGQKIMELVSGTLQAGRHSYQWNAGDLASGTYFCQLKAGDFLQTRKMLLIR
jgi:hypothetical protein